MKTASLIALKAFPYDGEDLKVGDKFSAVEEHANILVLLGQAERHTVLTAPPAEVITPPEPVAPSPVVNNEPSQAVSPPWASSKKSGKKTSE